jgi:hypothetical protein
MATNKAKRPFSLAQPQPQRPSLNPQPATAPMPVKSATYRALAELNAGFDKVLHDLGTLRQNSLFHSDALSALHQQLSVIRARANREVLSVLGERESANAGHFERLRGEGATSPPAGN